jgi:cobalt transporter subunit CbtB
MTTNPATLRLSVGTTSASRLAQLGFAAFFGLFIVGFAGFSHIGAVHNAAHDVRHSLAFPCH